jgi:hypothetical protein
MLSKCLRHRGKGFVGELLILSAKGSSAFPPAVSAICPPPRSNRGTPNSSSSALICWVIAGCVSNSSSAARLKFRCCATALNTRMRKFSIMTLSVSCFPSNSNQLGTCLMTIVFYVEACLSLCWLRAGNGIQGLTGDCTGNKRGEQIAWQNNRQKMPLPGKFYCHQSRHQRSVRHRSH